MPTARKMKEVSNRASLADLAVWLTDCLDAKQPLPKVFDGYCNRLLDAGLPLFRVTLGLETLHPEDSGTMLTWRDGALARRDIRRAGLLHSDDYLTSPTWVVDQTGRPFRWRAGLATETLPLIEELVANGMTDYIMLPLPFLDDTRTATMSYATRAAGGFDDTAIDLITRATTLISPVAERVVLRRIALDLLAAYVGPDAGRRVYEGRIERGDVETVMAAVLVADLRGFTALSERLPRREVVALLNRWFDALGQAIADQGGEILKFMGDGLLAVFPGAPQDTCARALRAARQALSGTDRLAGQLEAEGAGRIACGVALHIGEVELGNIGTRQRLDFTVIGPAVNHASRLQDLTKTLGEPILASADFAAACPGALRPVGTHALRGVATPVQVFAPAAP
ncbi:MAG: adenylate cyclase [Alphaproteobacteria bacterium]|nr:MAG: adenylate cyclase [Alphaproteobacteria bacterium]